MCESSSSIPWFPNATSTSNVTSTKSVSKGPDSPSYDYLLFIVCVCVCVYMSEEHLSKSDARKSMIIATLFDSPSRDATRVQQNNLLLHDPLLHFCLLYVMSEGKERERAVKGF